MYDILDKGSGCELIMCTDDVGEYRLVPKEATPWRGEEENAVTTLIGQIENKNICLFILNKSMRMGTLGISEGEKITLTFEYALKERIPVISIVASGGVRIQEGTSALLQMAKTSAAVKKHSIQGLLYISIVTNPTLGGVSASFASLADIIIAEPSAVYGFTGKRIIKETTQRTLPHDFQTAAFMHRHGMIDMIVPWENMKHTLSELLRLHEYEERDNGT